MSAPIPNNAEGSTEARVMQYPVKVTFTDSDPSPAIEAAIQNEVTLLDRCCDQITACHVTVTGSHRHHRQGRLYAVRIELSVPGQELVINREHPLDHAHTAIREAFCSARRVIDGYVRRSRGEAKSQSLPTCGQLPPIVLSTSPSAEVVPKANSLDSPHGDVSALMPALAILLEARELAILHEEDPWQFAVEARALKEAGLNNNMLRALLYKGLALQRLEITRRGAAHRMFRSPRSMRLEENSCFVLAEPGLVFARGTCTGGPRVASNRDAQETAVNGHVVPIWDTDRRELRLGTHVIKRYRRPAISQETILSAFAEEGWPPRIDNPLANRGETTAVDRLHDAVKRLNRLVQPILHFSSDGNAMGVQWDSWVSPR